MATAKTFIDKFVSSDKAEDEAIEVERKANEDLKIKTEARVSDEAKAEMILRKVGQVYDSEDGHVVLYASGGEGKVNKSVPKNAAEVEVPDDEPTEGQTSGDGTSVVTLPIDSPPAEGTGPFDQGPNPATEPGAAVG